MGGSYYPLESELKFKLENIYSSSHWDRLNFSPLIYRFIDLFSSLTANTAVVSAGYHDYGM